MLIGLTMLREIGKRSEAPLVYFSRGYVRAGYQSFGFHHVGKLAFECQFCIDGFILGSCYEY